MWTVRIDYQRRAEMDKKIEEIARRYHCDHSAFRAALREMAAYSYRQADAVVSELSPEIEHYDPALVITQIRERLQRLAESVENGGKP